jgi:hypothetical protein
MNIAWTSSHEFEFERASQRNLACRLLNIAQILQYALSNALESADVLAMST